MNTNSNTITVHKNGVLKGIFANGAPNITAFRAKVPLPGALSRAAPETISPHLPPGTQVATWAELHRYKPSPHLAENRAWMAHFTNRLPPGPCDCRPHWIALLNAYPPDFSNATRWFEWTVEAHNRVNQKLGKAVVSLEEAKKLWP